MKKHKIVFAVMTVMIVLCVIAVLWYWIMKETGEPQKVPEKTDDTSEKTEAMDAVPSSRPIIDLDEGNEIYLDSDVVAALTRIEAEGEEEHVNAILDGEILLINHYARTGYSKKAICQVQRFYYGFYDQLKSESIGSVIEKLSACIPAEGATPDGFSQAVQTAFGWGADYHFSYVIHVEVNE